MKMRITLLLAALVGASFIGSSCGGSGVGDPCVPEDEYVRTFGNFTVEEVNIESRSFQCLTRVCLVNHFQGRVSCPYGQGSEKDADGKDTGIAYCAGSGVGDQDCGKEDSQKHQTSCRIPDRDGKAELDRIQASVKPQFQERQAKDAVYCSCRCKGPDANARYCECPSGFACEELVKDQGLGKGQLAGSYCVKDGTEYQPTNKPSIECSSTLGNCGSTLKGGTGVNPPNAKIVDGAE
jgi:hypothetical protein